MQQTCTKCASVAYTNAQMKSQNKSHDVILVHPAHQGGRRCRGADPSVTGKVGPPNSDVHPSKQPPTSPLGASTVRAAHDELRAEQSPTREHLVTVSSISVLCFPFLVRILFAPTNEAAWHLHFVEASLLFLPPLSPDFPIVLPSNPRISHSESQ